MSKFAQICFFHPRKVTQLTDSNEIWRVVIYCFLPNLARVGEGDGRKTP